MNGFSIDEMIDLQNELQRKYKGALKNESLSIDNAKTKMLWMICEIGEVIDIIKKNGEITITEDKVLRKAFVEEMSDVLMYYIDILMCFNVSSEELKGVYIEKNAKNQTRWKKE